MKHNYLCLIACILLLCISCSTSDTCPDAICDDYLTQSADYETNRESFGKLDHDSDGWHTSTCYQVAVVVDAPLNATVVVQGLIRTVRR